jgi:predicted PurR-regulated permease PerM
MLQGFLGRWWAASPPAAKIALLILAIPALVLNIWVLAAITQYFHSLLVVLIASSLLAFLLNYPVTFMTRHGAKRERAAIFVFLLTITILVALGVTLFPLVQQQARQLLTHLPEWLTSGQRQIATLNEQLKRSGLPFNLDALVGQISGQLEGQIKGAAGEAVSVAAVTVGSLLDGLLTLVLSFYLLQHGEQIWRSIMDWLPNEVGQPFSQTLRLSFQNFFLGQLIMATCLGLTLTLVFLILRVPFGLLFGLFIGVMALIPFGGTVSIILVTLLVLLRDIGLGLKVLLACVLVQQIMENLIAPRILGRVTGLNPFWVFISILVGARIAGLLGVIIAVPIAVVIKSALVTIRANRFVSESPGVPATELTALPPLPSVESGPRSPNS